MERIRTLGLVFLSLGIIEFAWALFCVAGGALLGVAGFADDRMGRWLWVGTGAYLLIGAVAAVLGFVHSFAGLRLRAGKGLVLAIVAIAACLVSMVFALYCSPFAVGAAVYGIVVLLDPEARRILDG